ncbi:hypothetical protein MF672_022410 [Actinomadura sp. ATCC 31491]|uniref:Lantibiotic dehydratase N-terminal domain-containing protein n=1 Tax=Actinomadura luzonensis TaxID=2805427 RepID=A0ABT0FW40_9ACTN|nr:hypothetical protein [Actinomadura luzonensis]MCK2216532.1 hypothetical protein [Actinomadura luzonensis]
MGEPGTLQDREWTLVPAVVVRSAGFPWELVQSLAYPRAAETAAAVALLESRALGLLAAAPARREARPAGPHAARAGTLRLPRGLRGRLRRLRPLPPGTPGPEDWLADWNHVTGLLEEARLALAEEVAADAALARAAATGLATDERFLEALVCSAPAAYRDLRRGPADPARLAPHVQWLATRAAPTGFHAPEGAGRVEPALASGYTWAGHRELTRRVAYPAARVGEALHQRVLADLALVAGLVPRRRAGTAPPADGAAFAARCDGRRTVAEIAADCGISLERASAALAVAVRRGLLTHDLWPPATVADPVAWLGERLPGDDEPAVPDRGLVPARGVPAQRRRALAGARATTGTDLPAGRRVREIAALLERYPAASPEVKLAVQSRIEALTGGAQRAGRDERSGARVIVREAAAGTLRTYTPAALAAACANACPPRSPRSPRRPS